MQSLPVSALMRVCPDAVISEQLSLRAAAEILITHGFSALIAHDALGKLAGVVPETAVIRALMETTSRTQTVASILSRHAESVRPDACLSSVLHLFRASCHCVIPVIDSSGAVVGLLHRQDVVRLLLSESDAPALPQEGNSEDLSRRKPHFLDRPSARSERLENQG
ncbi:MAG: CBS domain-containing protein [Planctomycetaceae bacterium]